jgi:hypothetical protein
MGVLDGLALLELAFQSACRGAQAEGVVTAVLSDAGDLEK